METILKLLKISDVFIPQYATVSMVRIQLYSVSPYADIYRHRSGLGAAAGRE